MFVEVLVDNSLYGQVRGEMGAEEGRSDPRAAAVGVEGVPDV